MIDLRSDTVTRPTAGMREAIARADVGDDVYGEDPTVNALETAGAAMLDKEAGLYVPSGTQSNLLALLSHCGRGDEYIVGQAAHTYRFEGGGAAALGGIQPQPLEFEADGTLDLDRVTANIKPDDFHFAVTRLLCLENTTGGKALPLSYLTDARALCNRHRIGLHLDGARFFNAVVATGVSAETLAEPFDSVSVCLSKGLGAPVGSLLIGTEAFIASARRWRKMVGGGMRQAGVIAAAGLYALEHHVERLADDHRHAAAVAAAVADKFGDDAVAHDTNMVHVHLPETAYARLRDHLQQHGVTVRRPRWVFHLDIDDSDVDLLITMIESFTPAE